MKRVLFLSAIAFLLIISGCSKDEEGPSIRELLLAPSSWEMTSITGPDPTGEYADVVALVITFYSNGEYEYYIAFDGGTWESDDGVWELNGNTLTLDSDLELTIIEMTTLISRLKDSVTDATLNFRANP